MGWLIGGMIGYGLALLLIGFLVSRLAKGRNRGRLIG